MFNGTNSCGPNEATTNMMASINASQSNVSRGHHNLNDIGKYVHQTPSSASEYYDPFNFQQFGRPVVNMPPIMHPFQTYQNMGHGTPTTSQYTQFSNENAPQKLYPAVHTNTQSESHNNMFSYSENYHTKTLSDLLSSTFREPTIGKGYHLNVPQVPSHILRKSSSTDKVDQKLVETSESTDTVAKDSTNQEKMIADLKSDQSNTENSDSTCKDLSKDTKKKIPKLTENHTDQEKLKDKEPNKVIAQSPDNMNTEINNLISSVNLGIGPEAQEKIIRKSLKVQKTMYKIINSNTAEDKTLKPIIFKKTLSESKRKSLEKTVKIIENIICNSTNNTKPKTQENIDETIEEITDPLAFSPCPKEKCSEESNSDSDTDDEVEKNILSKPKSTSLPINVLQENINSDKEDSIKEVSMDGNVNTEDIKVESSSWDGFEFEDPFLKDINGANREKVDDKIIDMESSVEEAVATVKSGIASNAYFECPHCQLLFIHPKRFLIHVKWHSFGLLNEKRAQLARERENHARMKRDARREERLQRISASLPETDVETFRCKDCDIVLPTKSSYKAHRTRVHPRQIKQCKVCQIPLSDFNSLREHLQTHEDKDVGGHQCPHCLKWFKHRHSLTKHVDVHLEKTHSCPTCGKLFGSEALVKRHLVIHERQARAPHLCCTYCGKAFYEAYHLKVHERTHKNDRPFKCETCQSGFVTNSGLKRHIRVSHNVNGAKPYACPVCKKCFSSAAIRARHELRAHADQTLLPHHCTICDARFVKLKDLKTHIYRLHPTSSTKKKKSKRDDGCTEFDEQIVC